MKYNGIVNFYSSITLVFLILFIIYKSRLNILFSIYIDNNKPLITLSINYLFNLLNINIQVYPPKKMKNISKKVNNDKVKEKIKKNKLKVLKKDVLDIYNIAKNMKIKEFYSCIQFGNENIYFTSFIYVLINSIYGILSNLVNTEKIYLSCIPCFTNDYIKGDLKIHISPKIQELIKLSKILFRIYRNNKEGVNNESNRFNKKSYGNNS